MYITYSDLFVTGGKDFQVYEASVADGFISEAIIACKKFTFAPSLTRTMADQVIG